MIVKRIDPLSFAKITGLLYVFIGLCIGALFSLISVAGFATSANDAGMFGAIIGVGAVVVLPIVYGCMGFIGTLIAAWLYNMIAGVVGGVELEIQ